MALQTQIIPISFEQGVDTKTDEKLVLPGKLTLLENGLFNKGKKIRKRPGYDALPKDILGGGQIGTGQGLLVFDDELLEFAGHKLYSFADSIQKWVDKGSVYSVNVGRSQVIRNSFTQTSQDMAIQGTLALYAWDDTHTSSGTHALRASCIDLETGLSLFSDTELQSNVAPKIRVVTCAGSFFLFSGENANLKVRKLDPANPNSFQAAVTLGTDFNGLLDVVSDGSKMVLVYKNTSNEISVKYVTSTMVVGSPSSGLPNPISIAENPSELAVFQNSMTGDVFVYWYNSAGGAVKYAVRYADFTQKLAPTNIETGIPASSVGRITATLDTGENQKVFWTRNNNAGGVLNDFVKVATVSPSAVVTAAAVLKRSVSVAGKAFNFDGTVYFLTVFASTIQPSYFLMDSTGYIIAKTANQLAGGAGNLPAFSISGTKAYTLAQIKTQLVSDNGDFYSALGLAQFNFDLNAENNFSAKKLGENLHISGGYVAMYDGQSVVEHGFHVFPEGISTANIAGSIANGTYLYYVTYEWTDNKGQRHQSAPSTAYSVTVGGGPAGVRHTVPTLRLTQKTAPRDEVKVVLWRTKASATVPFRIGSTANNPATDSVTIDDTLADSSIGANQILYTTGGVVENIAAPACKVISTFKKRLITAGLEDELDWQFSKEFESGNGVEFFDGFRNSLKPAGGPLRVTVEMDGKHILFKDNLIFGQTGDGPNKTGGQDSFSEPEEISTDVGCPYQNSVVSTPMGIMFKSFKGIYLLTRSLQVQYIGADVEAYNGNTVVSADLLQDENLVVFVHSDGPALMYDYYRQQWSVATNHLGVDAAVWKGNLVYLRQDGKVYKRNLTKFADDNAPYKLRIGTAWIKTAGVQGFQRARRFAVLGDFASSHQLRTSIGYDYEPYYRDFVIFNASGLIGTEEYGDDVTYGDSEVYGGSSDNVYQFRGHLARQKCQSIRFLFEDLANASAGESYSLSDLSLEVAVKRGLNKLKASKSLG